MGDNKGFKFDVCGLSFKYFIAFFAVVMIATYCGFQDAYIAMLLVGSILVMDRKIIPQRNSKIYSNGNRLSGIRDRIRNVRGSRYRLWSQRGIV